MATTHLFLLLRLFLVLIVQLGSIGVYAQRNVSIDDSDPSIVYEPPGAWALSANSSLDYGGSHMLTQNPNATATFNFTGIAIYFLSPLWPYLVNTALSLDGGQATLVDLVDHSQAQANASASGSGAETVRYAVVWGVAGLEDKVHTLVVSVGVGQPFAVLDGLIYTTLDAGNSTTSTPEPTTPTPHPTTTSCSSSSSCSGEPPTASSDPASSTPTIKPQTPIAVGSVLGIFGLLVCALFIWFCVRKKRRPRSEAWTITRKSFLSKSARSGRSGGRGGGATTRTPSPATWTGTQPSSGFTQGTQSTVRPSPISLGPPATYPAAAFLQQHHPHLLLHHHPGYGALWAPPLGEGDDERDEGPGWERRRRGFVGVPVPYIPEGYAEDGGRREVDCEDGRGGYSYLRAADAVVGGEYAVPEFALGAGTSVANMDMEEMEMGGEVLLPPQLSSMLLMQGAAAGGGGVAGRYTPGVALSTITENSPTVTERGSTPGSGRGSASPAVSAVLEGVDVHQSAVGNGVNGLESGSNGSNISGPNGNGAGTGTGTVVPGLSARHVLQRARPSIRAGSLLARRPAVGGGREFEEEMYPARF